ncbi:MAG: insulinase family protein, partial [Burkholderiales bacterium]|nr:insulinase family protein [Burkholderiales bacterium]
MAISVSPAVAQHDIPGNVVKGASVEGVTSYTLANGLTVLLFPDESKPTTTVNVTYLVGSRHENYGETGMAHLLEHLMFKGTKTRGNIFEDLGKRGMQFNGTTYYDRTNYFETFTESEASLKWALEMEADRMVNANIWRSDLDTEMTVVRNEYENGENKPLRVLWGRLQSAAFDWHNYGNLTIGARSDIENVDIDRLQAFYRTYYQPDNAVLIVTGKFKEASALKLITETFGVIPKPTRVLPKLYTQEPVQEGEKNVTVRRVGGTPWIGALYHTASGPDPDTVALDAFGEIMTQAPSGRLYKALVATHKAAAVDVWGFSLADPGMLIFWTQLAPNDVTAPVKKIIFNTLYGFEKNPITEEEVNRVRARMMKNFNEVLRDPEHFALELSEAIAQGDWRLFFIQRDVWRKLTKEDVQKAALKYIKPTNVTIGEYQPIKEVGNERATLAPKIDVAALVANYRGDAAIAAGESFDATPENLEARTHRQKLDNGLKLAFLSKKTRGATARFRMRFDWGDAQQLQELSMVGQFTAEMLSLGTKNLNRQAFEDKIDALEARLSITGDATGVVVSGETVREHLPELLALAAEALQTPAFPKSELDKLIRERLTDIESNRTDPREIAFRALRRTNRPYPKNDVRYTPTVDEEMTQIRHVTVAKVKSFHNKF